MPSGGAEAVMLDHSDSGPRRGRRRGLVYVDEDWIPRLLTTTFGDSSAT